MPKNTNHIHIVINCKINDLGLLEQVRKQDLLYVGLTLHFTVFYYTLLVTASIPKILFRATLNPSFHILNN